MILVRGSRHDQIRILLLVQNISLEAKLWRRQIYSLKRVDPMDAVI